LIMSEGKEEIIIDVDDGAENSNNTTPPKATKQLAPVTKFFICIFSALLIYHFVSSWMANGKINNLTTQVGDLKLEVQKLTDKNQSLEKKLNETKTNLDFVDKDRVTKINELGELNKIIETMKENIPQGSKLLVEKLEKKIQEWEAYHKSLEETLKTRPNK